MNDMRLDPQGTTPATVVDDGIILQVPNKHVMRLIQLGIGVDRANRVRSARRKAQKAARRRNRSK
ncbi:MAG: hypothetical protein ACXVGB_00065 [Mycobacteriaceae bacterium]